MVNVGETEYRALDTDDKALLKAAAVTGGVSLRTLDAARVMALYTAGLLYFAVPILHSDHVAIPPLEVCCLLCGTHLWGVLELEIVYDISVRYVCVQCMCTMYVCDV